MKITIEVSEIAWTRFLKEYESPGDGNYLIYNNTASNRDFIREVYSDSPTLLEYAESYWATLDERPGLPSDRLYCDREKVFGHVIEKMKKASFQRNQDPVQISGEGKDKMTEPTLLAAMRRVLSEGFDIFAMGDDIILEPQKEEGHRLIWYLKEPGTTNPGAIGATQHVEYFGTVDGMLTRFSEILQLIQDNRDSEKCP